MPNGPGRLPVETDPAAVVCLRRRRAAGAVYTSLTSPSYCPRQGGYAERTQAPAGRDGPGGDLENHVFAVLVCLRRNLCAPLPRKPSPGKRSRT